MSCYFDDDNKLIVAANLKSISSFIGIGTSFAIQQRLVQCKGIFQKDLKLSECKFSSNLLRNFQLILCLFLKRKNQSSDYTVNFGTKIYVDQDVSVNQRFSAIAEHNYLADVEALNFNEARASAQKINKWISESTKGHIKDLVTEDSVSNSIILLINALYFEGTWRFQFGKTLTKPFLTSQGKKVDKPFMEQTGSFYYFFSKHLNSKILRLPYNGRRFSMFIILPNEVNGLEAVIERLDSNSIKNEVWHMDELEVHIQMPKFKFDSSINLNEVVKKVKLQLFLTLRR